MLHLLKSPFTVFPTTAICPCLQAIKLFYYDAEEFCNSWTFSIIEVPSKLQYSTHEVFIVQVLYSAAEEPDCISVKSVSRFPASCQCSQNLVLVPSTTLILVFGLNSFHDDLIDFHKLTPFGSGNFLCNPIVTLLIFCFYDCPINSDYHWSASFSQRDLDPCLQQLSLHVQKENQYKSISNRYLIKIGVN